MKGTEIILRNENGDYSVATSEPELSIDRVSDLIYSVLIAAGYLPETVIELFKGKE